MSAESPSYYRRQYVPQEEKTHEVPDDLIPAAPSKVLMLEDDLDLANMLAEALQPLPCATTIVANGAEGLRHILSSDFDIIVCDMVMPTLPGDKFYLAVEKTRPHLCKRFVFMTGHTAEKKWDEFARSKGCVILWKPFELHVFLDVVKAVLRKAKS